MKRYGKREIKKAWEKETLLNVSGFEKTKFISIPQNIYNLEIFEKNLPYSSLSVNCYDDNKQIIGMNALLSAFVQVYK